jgi:hypothetical protein
MLSPEVDFDELRVCGKADGLRWPGADSQSESARDCSDSALRRNAAAIRHTPDQAPRRRPGSG